MPKQQARKYDMARGLETVIEIKQRHIAELTSQAVEHARLAVEQKDEEHAKKALKLRGDIQYWKDSIARNRKEIARLSGVYKAV